MMMSDEEFTVQKKPPMPHMPHVVDNDDRNEQYTAVTYKRAEDLDLQVFKKIASSNSCPEYLGYNTQICREQGHAIQPKTRVIYLPLIDKPPTDYATIKRKGSKA